MALERYPGFFYHDVYHGVRPEEAVAKMVEVRQRFVDLATFLEQILPEMRERNLCLTHLEDASMRAIQTLALHYGAKQGGAP